MTFGRALSRIKLQKKLLVWLILPVVLFSAGALLLRKKVADASQPSFVTPTLPNGITSNGNGTYSGTVMPTTINSTNFPGLFNNPVIKTVKASGGDYTTLQAAFNAIGTDAPNCDEIIEVDSGYTAQSLGTNQTLTYQYSCPPGSWVWVRPSNYSALPPQNQTVCTTAITNASENGSQTTATFTTSRNNLLTTGMSVRVKGVSDDDFNADYTVTGIVSPTTFTVANTTAAPGMSSSGGTMIPIDLYLNPSACPDVPNMFTVAKTGGNTYDQAFAIDDDSEGDGVSTQGLIISGMQLLMSTGATTFQGVQVGNAGITNTNYANHVIIDRSYIVAPTQTNFVQGVVLQGPYEALVDSYVDGVKDLSGYYAETHAVFMPWGPGPYKIVDNYIGGLPTENIFSGGDTVGVTNAIPDDVEIRANTLYSDFPNRSNTLAKKNIIEFKAVQRLLIDGNTLEYSWNTNTGASQRGAAIVFNTLNQTGEATWNTDQDITITNNDVQHFGDQFLLIPGRTGIEPYPTYPLNNRVLVSNNMYRDWNQQTYNTGLGGINNGGLIIGPGYFDASHPASGPDNVTLIHDGIYGSPNNQDNLGIFSGFWNPANGATCPWSGDYTGPSPMPDFTFHANVTVLDDEFAGDCEDNFDGFNEVPGFFTNVNWSDNIHVQDGVDTGGQFVPADFTTAGPGNQFPQGGASGVAPAGMFNNYPACVGVPAGPLTTCALQSGSGYTQTSSCDNADCGPNISNIEVAQTRDNDDDGGTVSSPPPAPPTPPAAPTISSFTASPASIQAGSSFELAWSVSGATSLSINQGVGTVTSPGEMAITPATTTTYTLTATNSGGSVVANATVTVTPAPTPTPTSTPSNPTSTPDTTPPTVQITSPTSGATVSGVINPSASASDNVGVTEVQWYIDGTLASTNTVSPYTFSLNTATLSGGSHILQAKAYDAAGNIGTSPSVSIVVSNTSSGGGSAPTGGGGGGSGVVVSVPPPPNPPITEPTSTPANTYFPRILTVGNTGSDVLLLEKLLQSLGFFPSSTVPTDYVGPVTEHAISLFQGTHHLVISGYLDPATQTLMNKVMAANPIAGAEPSTSSSTSPTTQPITVATSTTPTTTTPSTSRFLRNLSFGSTGTDVTALQKFLNQDGDYPSDIISGYYGSLTVRAVELFQMKHGIFVYGTLQGPGFGQVGPKTRNILNAL